MPIFEFVCSGCGRKFSALVGVVAAAQPPACPKCGSSDLKKLVSRFARVRSEEESLDSLADAAEGADLEDPRTLRRFMKEMRKEMGEDMEGEDFEEMMEEAAADDQSENAAGEGDREE